MGTNWKRVTLGAIMYASLTLFLFGCSGGGGGGTQTPDLRTISGIASDPVTGLPLPNVPVTAYAINADGSEATTPLSIPATGKSDGQRNYLLTIPAAYAGGVMVVATLPDGSKIRAVIPSLTPGKTPVSAVMVSQATEMAAQFIDLNYPGSFTPAHMQTANLVLEQFFGMNFSQIPPPAKGAATTKAQQDLLDVIQGVNSLLSPSGGYTLAGLLTATFGPGGVTIGLGQNPALADLIDAVGTPVPLVIGPVTQSLINAGLLPGGYIPPSFGVAPIPVPPTPDLTPPAAPANLTATATASTAILSWTAATDNVGVTNYYIYRDGVFIASLTAPADPLVMVTFTDTGLTAATAYRYEVRARDAAGNVSPSSGTVSVTTAPVQTYTISGTITVDGGTPLAGVYVTVTGVGSGIAITDSAGFYSFSGARPGIYSVTPSLAGFMFTPASLTISVVSSNLTGANFTTTTPSGTVIGGVVYPDGVIIGGVTYPPGTIVGGITYPSGVVIGGVTYPYATVIGGVTYPTGSVIGGVVAPGGVVIGGIAYPDGTVIGGVTYPPGTVIGGIAFPPGSITGSITYPIGSITGGVFYPSGTISGGASYPGGAIGGGIYYPSGTIIGTTYYPSGAVIGGIYYPDGSVSGGVSYPGGTTTGSVSYPTGTISNGVFYPGGSISGGGSYPGGSTGGTVFYPNGSAGGSVTYPSGTASVGAFYPGGAVIGGSTYPAGTADSSTYYPTGSTSGSLNWNYLVYGKVTYNGAGLAGVTVTIDDSGSYNAVTTTDLSGNYSFFTAVTGGSYTVTPALAGYVFTPASSPVTVNTTNVQVPVFTGN